MFTGLLPSVLWSCGGKFRPTRLPWMFVSKESGVMAKWHLLCNFLGRKAFESVFGSVCESFFLWPSSVPHVLFSLLVRLLNISGSFRCTITCLLFLCRDVTQGTMFLNCRSSKIHRSAMTSDKTSHALRTAADGGPQLTSSDGLEHRKLNLTLQGPTTERHTSGCHKE